MKTHYLLLSLLILTMVMVGCGVKKQTVINNSIIGSWEGCDGRVITFTQEGDSILGHYTKLNGLERFGFSQNEIGYKLIRESVGSYTGQVKWRAINIKEPTWRAVKVSIHENTYQDIGSDRCGREMTRIKEK